MNNLKVTILPALNAQELLEVEKIAKDIWREYYPGIISPEQIEYMLKKGYSLEVMQREVRKGVHYDRLLVNDRLVGYCSYGADKEQGALKLHKLYIKPDFHGLGLGKKLLKRVENYGQNGAFEKILLQVNKYNRRAIAAYERFGFKIREAAKFDIGEGFVMDDFVMMLNLKNR